MTLNRTSPKQPKRSDLRWQILLIVLPLLILAGFGVSALRQEKRLAEFEAREQAAVWGRQLAARFETEWLTIPSITPELALNFADNPTRPTEEPLLAAWEHNRPRLLLAINAAGALVYPAPVREIAPALLLPWNFLTEPQRALWDEASDLTYTTNNPRAAVAAWKRFQSSQPAEPFASLGKQREAVLIGSLGQFKSALDIWRGLTRISPDIRTESGIPLALLAGWQWLRTSDTPLATAQEREAVLDTISAQLVLRPENISTKLLENMSQYPRFTPSMQEKLNAWQRVQATHQLARQLHSVINSNTLTENWSRLSTFDGEWLTRIHGTNQLRWASLLPLQSVRDSLADLQRELNIPAHFQVGLRLDDVDLATISTNSTAFATVNREWGTDSLQVTLGLTDSSVLFAQQRARAWRFGTLLVLSALAALAGVYGAARAFQRQRHLSELKTNFVSSVSHELRAPIASVRLMAEELQDGEEQKERNRSYHKFIVQECRRLSALIENVLDFARNEQGRQKYEFEPTDLAALLKETCALLQPTATERELKLHCEVLGEPIEYDADGQALQRVLINLLDNAFKHAPPHSVVTASLVFTAKQINLVVADQGPGIPAEDHARIFEQFYRRGSELRRETQGIGLGLAIVKQIITAHGGIVSVESSPGKGATFTCTLPVVASQYISEDLRHS